MEHRHLLREVKTALELAIALLAPSDIVDSLAVVAGLLDAFAGLGMAEPAAHPLIAATTERATLALAAWHRWEQARPKPTA